MHLNDTCLTSTPQESSKNPQKFAGHPDEEEIRATDSPMSAAKMGRDRTRPLRNDWDDVKNDIMHEALFAKFTQYETLRRDLLATGEAILIEHTTNDAYWGDGGDGSGENRLVTLLMELSERLRRNAEHVSDQHGKTFGVK